MRSIFNQIENIFLPRSRGLPSQSLASARLREALEGREVFTGIFTIPTRMRKRGKHLPFLPLPPVLIISNCTAHGPKRSHKIAPKFSPSFFSGSFEALPIRGTQDRNIDLVFPFKLLNLISLN